MSSRKYTPSVIEPSFGIGRIIYGILEHSYAEVEKNGEKQSMLRLSAAIAPYKCAVLPLTGDSKFNPLVEALEQSFVRANISTKVDTSGTSIGRKYARADEIGVPYAITLDPATLKDQTVTLRDRDTTLQIRIPREQVTDIVNALLKGKMTWKQAQKQFPAFSA